MTLGSSPWNSYIRTRIQLLFEKGLVQQPKFFDFFSYEISQNVPVRAVESSIPVLVKDLQANAFVVLALTARGKNEWYASQIPGVDEFTKNQLSQARIDLNQTALPMEFEAFSSDEWFPYAGVLFTSHTDKGAFLAHLLNRTGYSPSKIVFVDDRLEQVQSVEAVMQKLGIPFTGYHYRYTEDSFKTFQPEIGIIQFLQLMMNQTLLSDAEAQELSQSMPQDQLNELMDELLIIIDQSATAEMNR